MKNDALVRVYTRPLFDLAVEGQQIEAIAEELATLDELFKAVPEFEEYLDSPNASRADKIGLMQKAYGKPWSDYFSRFMDLILRKGRQEILPFVNEAYSAYWDDYRSRMDVTVTSAVELSDDQRSALVSKLSAKTGKKVDLKCNIDPSILGGLRIQIGHQLVDATLTGKLASLREQLLG